MAVSWNAVKDIWYARAKDLDQRAMMNREPHIHTPAHDPHHALKPENIVQAYPLGSAPWFRRILPKKPDWWDRVFSQPFDRTEPR